MSKLILQMLLIIGVLLISGCTQERETIPTIQTDQKNGNQTPTKQDDSGITTPVYGETNPKQVWETFKDKYGLPGEMKAGGAGIKWNEERGIPIYIVGFKSSQYYGSPQEVATSFLQEHGNLMQLQNNSLFFVDVYASGEESTVIYEQRYEGIPVYGTKVQTLVTSDMYVRQLSADYFPNIKLVKSEEDDADASDFKVTISKFLINNSFKEGQELDDFVESREPEKFIYPLSENSDTKFYSILLYRLPGARLFLNANTAEIVNVEKL